MDFGGVVVRTKNSARTHDVLAGDDPPLLPPQHRRCGGAILPLAVSGRRHDLDPATHSLLKSSRINGASISDRALFLFGQSDHFGLSQRGIAEHANVAVRIIALAVVGALRLAL